MNRRAHRLSSKIETLEARRLLSVAASNGVLTITGTAGNDSYQLTKSGTNLSVVENGGAAKLFPLSSINLINATLGNGADSIGISNSITINASVSGGDGADGIVTGGGNDTLDGGTGDDYVDGRDGNDTVTYASRNVPIHAGLTEKYSPYYAGPVAPVVTRAGSGGATGENDTYASIETLTGGSAADMLYTSPDRFSFSGEGTEVPPPVHAMQINGGDGNDTIYAGASSSDDYNGNSFLQIVADGGNGDDYLQSSYSELNNMTLRGGAGDDYFTEGTDDRANIEPGDGFDIYSRDTKIIRDYTMPAGLEVFIAQDGGGNIVGNDEDNIISGGGNVDGRGGNDLIVDYDHGFGTVTGGTGDDTIEAGAYAYSIDGGEGNDRITLDNLYPIYPDRRITVTGGAGADQFAVLGDLPVVTFDGGADADSLTIDTRISDYGYPGSTLYTLDTSSFSVADYSSNGSGGFQLNTTKLDYLNVGTIDVSTPDRNSGIHVVQLNPNAKVTIRTGNADDTVTVDETPASATLHLIDGGGYYDMLSINANGVGSASVTLPQAATFHTVSIGSGGKLTIPPSVAEANSVHLIQPAFAAGSIVDLNNNAMIVDASGPEWLPQFMTQLNDGLRAGRNGGAWNGAGIRSSTAASTPGTTLGIAKSSELFNTFPATIASQSVGPNAIIIRYTKSGDVNLDRQVNFTDLVILAQNYNKTGRTYAQGNLDYSADGVVNFADLVLLAQNYNGAMPRLASISTPPAKATKKTVVSAMMGVMR